MKAVIWRTRTVAAFAPLLALLLLLTLPAVVQAQFFLGTNNGAITIRAYYGPGGAVVIPSTTNGFLVVAIGDAAFSRTMVSSVSIPDSITSIGANTYYGCSNLTSISIPNSVTNVGIYAFSSCASLTNAAIGTNVASIAAYAFSYCTNLTAITIPNSANNIGDCAFYHCSSLASVTIGGNVTNVGNSAFEGCVGLTELTIPDSLISIGTYAFYQCSSLASVTMGTNVTSIGSWAFYHCFALASVTIPNSVLGIGAWAFNNCSSLASVTVGTNVASIGDSAFSYCVSLPAVTIPDSVINIGPSAFALCSSLTNVTIGKGVASIGSGAFSVGRNLANITVDPLNSFYSSLEGVLFNYDRSTLIQCPAREAGTYTVPGSVTNIAYRAFYGCTSLTNVSIGEAVTTIQDSAFNQCPSLMVVYFQGNAPSLGGTNVFRKDTNATVYYLPGTTGWDQWVSPPPAVLWRPQIQPSDGSFGVQTNQFGFNIAWASGMVVVVEACTNLARPIWLPLQTNTLSADSLYFNDPQWTNYPARLYRIRSP